MERICLALLVSLIHVPYIVMICSPFEKIMYKKQKKILYVSYAVILIPVAIMYFIINTRITYGLYRVLIMIVCGLLTGMNVLVIKGHWREHLFVCGLALLQMTVPVTGIAYLEICFMNLTSNAHLIILNAACVLAVFLLLYQWYHDSTQRVVAPFLSLDCGDYWKGVWHIPLLLFFTCYITISPTVKPESIWVPANRILLLVTTIKVSNAVANEHKRMKEKQEMNEHLNVQKIYYASLSGKVAELRKEKHDMKHHIAAMQNFSNRDNKEELQNYCNRLMERYINDIEIPYTGNMAVDGIVYRYAQLADQYNVSFEYAGTIDNIDMEDIDLSVLLGNALDNALDGCLTIPYKRYISLKMKSLGDEVGIVVNNSFDGIVRKKDDVFLSRKRNDISGIGIGSMKSICERYGAEMEIRYKEGNFEVFFLIKKKK